MSIARCVGLRRALLLARACNSHCSRPFLLSWDPVYPGNSGATEIAPQIAAMMRNWFRD